MRTLKRPARQGFICTEDYKGGGHVDYKNGIIRDVKILGKSSRNHREYTPEAMQSAKSLYEGVRVNLDHPTKDQIRSSRSIRDWIGELQNVQVRDGGVYGDLHLLASHPHAAGIMEAADKYPSKFGLSHNADCSGFNESGRQVIESVDSVRSVDIVVNPATNTSLFESFEGENMKTTIRALANSKPGAERRRLLAMLEMDGEAGMGADSSNGVTQDSGAMIMGIVNNQDLTIDDKMTKIRKILEQQAGNPAVTATEGFDGGQRSALSFKDHKELSRLIDGKTPRGPQHSSARSHSVLESSSGQSAMGYQGGASGLSAAIGGKKHRIY